MTDFKFSIASVVSIAILAFFALNLVSIFATYYIRHNEIIQEAIDSVIDCLEDAKRPTKASSWVKNRLLFCDEARKNAVGSPFWRAIHEIIDDFLHKVGSILSSPWVKIGLIMAAGAVFFSMWNRFASTYGFGQQNAGTQLIVPWDPRFYRTDEQNRNQV